MKTLLALCCGCLLCGGTSRGQDLFDRLDEALSLSTRDGTVRARLSGLLDLENYDFEHPASGLIDTTRHNLVNPRLTLFLDAQAGTRIYLFAQARLDRGFDPGEHGPQVHLDEYALRYSPWDGGRLNLQFGKAATVVGIWTKRHLSWDNPFVNAPLPYENATAASDVSVPVRTGGGSDFGQVTPKEKYEYLPVIWGPSYTTGLTLSGTSHRVDYAAELKNAALAARPESWNATEVGFDHPAFDGRVGFRPDLAWNFGFSAGEGVYLRPEAGPGLSPGRGIGDYREILLGQDVSYAAGHWQFWAECFESRFEVPKVGRLDALTYYLEAKYKFTPQLFGALRWNQQLFARLDGSQPDTGRIDTAVGYRFTAHLQLKVQYSFQGGSPLFGRGSTVATQWTLRF